MPSEDLRGNNLDPLVDGGFEWANWFLMRYRDYAQAYFIQPVQPRQARYGLSYYPVHGTPTAPVKPMALGQKSSHKILSTDLLPEMWEGIANLDRSYETPPWIRLLLDARDAAHPGAGVVLAWAALEVVIDHALEVLSKHSQVPSGLWNWVATRNKKHWLQPTTEEQYTVLLELLGGRSLKNETKLWLEFEEMRTLRNNFSHGGRLELKGEPVSKQRIELLIRSARDIVAFVNEQLPPHSQWRMFPEYKGPYGAFLGVSIGPERPIS